MLNFVNLLFSRFYLLQKQGLYFLFIYFLFSIFFDVGFFDTEGVIACSSFIVFFSIINWPNSFLENSTFSNNNYIWMLYSSYVYRLEIFIMSIFFYLCNFLYFRFIFIDFMLYFLRNLFSGLSTFNFYVFDQYLKCLLNVRLKDFILLEFSLNKIYVYRIYDFFKDISNLQYKIYCNDKR